MTRAIRMLSSLAATCLFVALWLPWVDDEAGRTAGLLLLTGEGSDAPLAWARIAAGVMILAVLLGIVTVLRHWSEDTIDTVARWATATATFCGIAALSSVVATLRLGSRAGPGLPTTIVLAATATATLSVMAYTHRRRPLDRAPERRSGALFARRHVIVTAIVLVVGVVVAPVGGRWWTVWRHVDATTTSGPDSVPPATGPDTPRQVAWSRPADGVVPAGPYAVLLGDGDAQATPGEGISVVDITTGHERWRYRRDDGPVDNVVVDTAEDLLVASVELDEDDLYEVVALDLTTGHERWSRRTSAITRSAGDGVVLMEARRSAAFFAWDAEDGSTAWRKSLGSRCYENATTTATLLLVGPGCADKAHKNVAAGYSLRSGKSVWTHHFPSANDMPSLKDAVQVGHTVVLHVDGWWPVSHGLEPEGLVAYDTRSGTQLWRHRQVQAHGMSWMRGLVLLHGRRIRALDPRTGHRTWAVSPPAGHDRYVLASDHHRRGYAMARTRGHVTIRVFDASGAALRTASIPTCRDTVCRDGGGLGASATLAGVADGTLFVATAPYGALTGKRSRVAALR